MSAAYDEIMRQRDIEREHRHAYRAAALQGLLANPEYYREFRQVKALTPQDLAAHYKVVIKLAASLGDAMYDEP